ncbi:MAG: S8/S53 family peptidase [Chitinophagaceae bacterium]|nr:S8/S53 family peptidase [Chitinophagaceae bacterium]
MNKTFILVVVSMIVLASCKKSAVESIDAAKQKYSSEEIDAFIKKKIETEKKFEWNWANNGMVWSALNESDHILSVGYQPEGFSNTDNRLAEIDINSSEWKEARRQVMQIILEEESRGRKPITEKEIVQWDETVLPVIDVYITNLSTIEKLRSSKLVRYAEPMGYEPKEVAAKITSDSGCDGNGPETGLAAGVDYSVIAPGSKQSWNYAYQNIPSAWTKSTGAGIKIFVIDTGVEFDQENLGTAFNQGYSSGRSLERIVTYPRATIFGIPYGPVETPDDGCGHGTCMAGAVAAPRGVDGASCGVAYNCNLVTCRGAEDVFLDGSREVKGTSDGFTNAGNRSDVKIISMSMGRITSSSQLRDAIRFAYGKGKLIFCAAGTSFSWTAGWFGVIFPASMTEVNAVTGVRDNSFNTACTTCHEGSQTDFTVVMERASDSRHPLTLAAFGNTPSTVGGSSVATATTAGIAALVWSRYPAYNRDQILNKLIVNATNYPVKNSLFGWGNIDAGLATN